jgi:small subunit ribosomal protein S20
VANSAQARKRARQAEGRRQHNASQRSHMRTEVKKIVTAIQGGDKAAAQATYKSSVQVIDSMVNKGILHKNKAARHKSRLNAHIRAL